MSKAKSIGTRAETAVRNYLLSAGYGQLEAHRNVLKGTQDEGDVWLRTWLGLIVFEVKGGKMAKEASYGQIEKWLLEATKERNNAGATHGFLVTQRAGVGYPRAGEWWAYTTTNDILTLHGTDGSAHSAIIRLTLQDLVKIIRGR